MVTNIKVKHDGTRCLIAIENCVGETARIVNQCLLSVLGMNDPNESVPAVVPVTEIHNALPEFSEVDKMENMPAYQNSDNESQLVFPDGEYKGKSPGQVIQEGDTKTVIKLLQQSHSFDENLKQVVVKECKQYIYQDLLKIDFEMATPYTIKNFFFTYRPLIREGIKEVLSRSGYSSLDDFL